MATEKINGVYHVSNTEQGGGGGSDPNAVKYTPQTLTDAQKTQARTNIGAGDYSVPSGGIPASDLSAAVAALLGTGVSDVSSAEDGSYVITLQNGNTFTISLLHTHTDKQDLLVSGENIKTINDESILGSGNLEIAGGAGEIPVDTAIPSGGLDANVHYALGTLTGSVSITLDTTSEVSGMLNIYSLAFTAGSTAPTITWPSGITSWAGNCLDGTTGTPVITGGNSYEVSIVEGMAVITEFVA